MLKDYGIPGWISSHGIRKYSVKIAVKRLAKDIEYPNGRFLMADTQLKWDNLRPFLFNVPKTHSFL